MHTIWNIGHVKCPKRCAFSSNWILGIKRNDHRKSSQLLNRVSVISFNVSNKRIFLAYAAVTPSRKDSHAMTFSRNGVGRRVATSWQVRSLRGNTLLKSKGHLLRCHGFVVHTLLTAHEQQCCRFQSYAKTVPSPMKLTSEIDKAWTTFLGSTTTDHVIRACDVRL